MSVLYDNYRHSAASANAYRANQSAFLWRWGFRQWGGTNARMEMGTAAEAAAYAGYLRGLSPEEIGEYATNLHITAMQGEVTDEARQAGECAVAFVGVMREQDWGDLLAYNPLRRVHLDGLRCEITIKPDFVFERAVVDLKATGVAVNEPRADHVRQVSLYAAEYERPGYLLYAIPQNLPKHPEKMPWKTAPTRTRLFAIGRDEHVREVDNILADFGRIERFDRQFPTARAATRVVPLCTDDFRWDEGDDKRAFDLWMEAELENME